jgi:hypothetical protein
LHFQIGEQIAYEMRRVGATPRLSPPPLSRSLPRLFTFCRKLLSLLALLSLTHRGVRPCFERGKLGVARSRGIHVVSRECYRENDHPEDHEAADHGWDPLSPFGSGSGARRPRWRGPR